MFLIIIISQIVPCSRKIILLTFKYTISLLHHHPNRKLNDICLVSGPEKKRNSRSKIENKPLLCYTGVSREKGNLHGRNTPDARDEEIRIHPFSPWGGKRGEGVKDGRCYSKNPLYQLWSCFLSRKGAAPTSPLPPRLPQGFSTLFMKITH